MSRGVAARGERLYRALLYVYPREFRLRYGANLVDAYCAQRAEPKYGGRVGGVRFWLDIVRDLIGSGVRVWLRVPVERDAVMSGSAVRSVDRSWSQRRMETMTTWLTELRQAARTLVRERVFTLTALTAIVFGIGGSSAVFSVVDALLLRPLPFPEAERLVFVSEVSEEQTGSGATSPETFRDWRRLTQSFENLAAWAYNARVLRTSSGTEVLTVVDVSPSFFEVLGRQARLGRTFVAADGGADAALVVLGEGFWRARFGGDPGVLGRTLDLDGRPYTVVGVMPSDVPVPEGSVAFWTLEEWEGETSRTGRYLGVVGRLAAGATREQADEELAGIAARLAELSPGTNRGWSVEVVPLHERIVGAAAEPLWLVGGSVALLLLVACSNVASLMLARTASRRRELAVRQALGGGWRIRRMLVTESVLLCGTGGVVGVALALFLVRLLTTHPPIELPLLELVRVDERTLSFAFAAIVVTCLGFTLWPGWRSSRLDAAEALRAPGAGKRGFASVRFRSALIMCEIAVAVMLVIGAVLLTRTLVAVRAIDPGFAFEDRIAARVFLDAPAYRDPARRSVWVAEVERELAALPGVLNVGSVSTLPMDPLSVQFDLPYRTQSTADLPSAELPQADFRVVSGALFDALGMRVQAGRTFQLADNARAPRVAIINQSLARIAFADADPIGQRITLMWGAGEEFEVIGVAGDTHFAGLTAQRRAEVYVHFPQFSLPFGSTNFVVHTTASASSLVRPIENAILAVDPAQPAHSVVPVPSLVAESIARERFATMLLLGLAGIALALAAIGSYGLVAYVVRRRAREIAIRIALGATRTHALGIVLRYNLSLAMAGTALGLLGAIASARTIEGLLFGVSPLDPFTFVAVPSALIVIALLAAAGPAWSAATIDPLVALRED